MAKPKAVQLNRYSTLIEKIFFDLYKEGAVVIPFARDELLVAAEQMKIKVPKNIGDLLYSFRYRYPLPPSILATQPSGKEWTIDGRGRALYAFQLVSKNRILPSPELLPVKIPDATPELVSAYAQGDEQALLAKVRYNRLIDLFLGLTTYSLQNHLRTQVSEVGQVEVDELYVGVDRQGCQYVIPVQAKGGNDRLAVVQTKQDIALCKGRFESLICRPISTQFMDDQRIVMFELAIQNDTVKVVSEMQYLLVPSDDISDEDLAGYQSRAKRR